jgi:hypothetical protein
VDSRVALICRFSRTFTPDTAKVETEACGLAFLDGLLKGGARLEYGELTPLRLLHRYKLVDLPEDRLLELLAAHVNKEWNVCRYFGAGSNDVFCFNLDNNRRTPSTTETPEMGVAVRSLRERLRDLRCEPLVVTSGRGYHVWCRLRQPVDNERLYRFLLPVAATALASIERAGYDHNLVKINLYPDVRLENAVSLRVFGSRHAKTGMFSHVWVPGGLLDEAASWDWFRDFVEAHAISSAQFDAACLALGSLFDGDR